jgi:hypothetical protein
MVRTEKTVIAGDGDEPDFTENYSPFHAEVSAPAGVDFVSYRVEVTSASTDIGEGGGIVRNLNLSVPNESYAGGTFTTTGTVDNQAGRTYTSVRVIAVLYEGGLPVRLGSAAAVPGELEDDGVGAFNITIPDVPGSNYEVRYFVDAVPQ